MPWRPSRQAALGLVLSTLCLGVASPARAGRTSHLFTDESQLVPEGDVEVEQWIWVQRSTWSKSSVHISAIAANSAKAASRSIRNT